jgi:hypothetical protein
MQTVGVPLPTACARMQTRKPPAAACVHHILRLTVHAHLHGTQRTGPNRERCCTFTARGTSPRQCGLRHATTKQPLQGGRGCVVLPMAWPHSGCSQTQLAAAAAATAAGCLGGPATVLQLLLPTWLLCCAAAATPAVAAAAPTPLSSSCERLLLHTASHCRHARDEH